MAALFPQAETEAERVEAAFGPTLYLHLSREDKVAQAVSLLRAEQTGLWHMGADGRERERTGAAEPLAYDAGRLHALVLELKADDAAWTRWFARQSIVPLRLSYEELSASPQASLASILAALGRDPAIAATAEVRTARLADQLSQEWAARFRAEAGST